MTECIVKFERIQEQAALYVVTAVYFFGIVKKRCEYLYFL